MPNDAFVPRFEGLAGSAESRVGQLLCNKWRLDRVLGSGGTATVYAATHRNGRRAAVKILKPELSFDPPARARFIAEGYVANRIDHPGAVAVLDDNVTEDGAVFLVMDLLEGETAEARVHRRGRLAVEEVVAIADHVLELLEEAHAKGIVHRDIKPDNVFLTVSGEVKVLDFGIAAYPDADRARTTQPGAFMGTPAFMSPEQARGRWDEVDARSDLWSLGATMFAMLSGRFVHQAPTLNEQLLAAMTASPSPLQNAAPRVPGPVAAVVDRALLFDKEARFQSAEQMRTALHRACELSGIHLDASGRQRPPSPRSSLHSIPFGSSRTISRRSDSKRRRATAANPTATPGAGRKTRVRNGILLAVPILVGAVAFGGSVSRAVHRSAAPLPAVDSEWDPLSIAAPADQPPIPWIASTAEHEEPLVDRALGPTPPDAKLPSAEPSDERGVAAVRPAAADREAPRSAVKPRRRPGKLLSLLANGGSPSSAGALSISPAKQAISRSWARPHP